MVIFVASSTLADSKYGLLDRKSGFYGAILRLELGGIGSGGRAGLLRAAAAREVAGFPAQIRGAWWLMPVTSPLSAPLRPR